MTNLKLVSHTERADTAGAAVGEPAAVKTPLTLINEDPAEEPDMPERAAQGDREALGRIYDRYWRRVYSLALRMLRNQSQAEEIAQDVFLTVWRRGGTYNRERGSFPTWIMSVAHNRCIDELRKVRRRARLPTFDIDDLHIEPSGEPEEVTKAVFNSLDREALLEALDRLPPAQKQVIMMAYFQGLTQSEISAELSTPLGTVKTRMRLGLHKMRGLLAA